MSDQTYSLSARHIAIWDHVIVDSGPDRLVLTGETKLGEKNSMSASLGLSYDQIDQLVLDLLMAKRTHEAR